MYFRKFLLVATLLVLLSNARAQSLTSFVDPYIGSGSHGHVFVGASVPFGAVQVGPNNIYKGWDWCSGYNYADSIMIGFSQTHLSGTGIGDLADVLIMPYTGKVRVDKGTEKDPASGYASHYSHSSESVKPGYYSVKLLDHDVRVELTASNRVGFHQYQFPAGKEAHIIIDLKEGINDRGTETYIKQVDATTFVGRRFSSGWAKDQRLYFAIKVSAPVNDFRIYENNDPVDGKEFQGKMTKGLISFPSGAPAKFQLKVGISPVSAENALANIAAEIPHWDFGRVVREADQQWNKELSTVQVQTKLLRDKKVFYTALYHTMINPSLFNDVNGEYRGADKQVHTSPGFQNYSVFSLWDTYRAANPLFNLIQPKRASDMNNSMVAIGQQQGMMPVWHLMGNETFTMAGISGLQVVAEAYLKGIGLGNADTALRVMKASAMSNYRGMGSVKENKTIPGDKMVESVAAAMEYAISDHAIALMAKRMKRMDDYNYFINRSKNYKLYWDAQTQFFRAKKADGNWTDNFSAMKTTGKDYTEGNAWQYLWLVPQDIAGLKSLLGGNEKYCEKLDSFFTLKLVEETGTLSDVTGLIGQYAHGNEPGHHIPYLYAHGGAAVENG